MPHKTVLHVGCGTWRPNALHPDYQTPEWTEIRLDINPDAKPDIVGSMTDMPMVATGSVDAVWNSHALEHLSGHEVPVALAEFHRVLRAGGHVFLRMPDLQKAAELVLAVGALGKAYDSPSGPIRPLDMLYGHGPSLARGESGMQHKTGFTQESIVQLLRDAGFRNANAVRKGFDVWARGEKHEQASA